MPNCWQVPYGTTTVFVILRYHGSTVVPPNTTPNVRSKLDALFRFGTTRP